MISLSSSNIKVTLIKSTIGAQGAHKKIISSLGLKFVGCSKVYKVSNSVLGQINKVIHLLKVESVVN